MMVTRNLAGLHDHGVTIKIMGDAAPRMRGPGGEHGPDVEPLRSAGGNPAITFPYG